MEAAEPAPVPSFRRFLRSRHVGTTVDVATWAVVVGCAVTVVSIAGGWVVTPRLVAAQGVLPIVVGLAVVATATAAVRRRRAALSAGAVVALWGIGMVAPVMLSLTPPAWADTSERLTVYSANIRRTNTTPDLAFAAAMERDADVVVFVEYASSFEPALRASGLLERYRTVVRDESHDQGLLLTRLPVNGTGVVSDAGFEMPTANVVVGSTQVLVAGVHALAPSQLAYMQRWRDQVPAVARAVDGHVNSIAIGDFNSSIWNPPLRELLDWGFVDAHDATGNGLARTWGPSPTGSSVSTPILGIDHAVSRGPDLAPLAVAEGFVPGSDHRSIEVTYAVRTSAA